MRFKCVEYLLPFSLFKKKSVFLHLDCEIGRGKTVNEIPILLPGAIIATWYVILSMAKYLKFLLCEIFYIVQNDISTESETK